MARSSAGCRPGRADGDRRSPAILAGVTAVSQLKPATPGPALREGRAPVSERLIAMLFLAALLHAIVILGLTFAAGGHGGDSDTPQLDVLLVTNEVPEAESNDQSVYLAQRTQAGSGNTDQAVASASPASRGATLSRSGAGRDSSGNAASDSRLDKPVSSRRHRPQFRHPLLRRGAGGQRRPSRCLSSSATRPASRAAAMAMRWSCCCAARRTPSTGSPPIPGPPSSRLILRPGSARSSAWAT
jgi:hypothetical protein